MHKTGLNAEPKSGIHDFTLQSLQYIISIIEAGNDWSEAQDSEGGRKEGCQQTGREDTMYKENRG